MNDIRAVTFDVGNTLVYCDPPPQEIYASALSRYGRPVIAEEVGPVFQEAWAAMQQKTLPGRDRYNSVRGGDRVWWGEFLRDILQRLDHDAPWEHLLDDLYAAFSREEVWHLFPDSRTTVEALRSRGFKVAVISNWDRRLPEILDMLDIAHLFDDVAVSALEGVEKPDSEFFRRSLERLGVAPRSVVHIGDSPREDYGGARAFGMHALLIDRKGLFKDGDFVRIDELSQVLDAVDTNSENTMVENPGKGAS